jgi:RNA polymerase sigma-70 factor (ECF subfamily)
MVTDAGTPVDQGELLAAARGGDEQAFTRLLEPHRRSLHVHCYRLLGSLHDADDALQETTLKAWRSIGSFEPRGPLRAWLYRIATNVCLRALERRARQPEVLDPAEAAAIAHLQPYPDRLLEGEVEERESIGLAFVTVMQLLPPRQRAVLVLRDVLGWSAREVADLLGDSVNSALQRGRETLERERASGRLAREHVPVSSATEARVVERFLAAWEAVDVDAIVDLLADDAVMTMPPEPLRVVGRREIGDFFRTVPAAGALEKIVLSPTRANGQPALAAYLESDTGELEPYGVMVLALEGESVASITGFAGQPELFPQLGLPSRVER